MGDGSLALAFGALAQVGNVMAIFQGWHGSSHR